MALLRFLPLLSAAIAIGCGTRALDGSPGGGGSSAGGGRGGAPVDAGGAATGGGPDAHAAEIIWRENCGNGVLDPGEACDDHNRTAGDGCTSLCQVECFSSCDRCGPPGTCATTTPPRCGDRRRDNGEACDDGNTAAGDGCREDCRVIESGWRCPVVGSRCIPICGDGMKVGPETCDDGDTIAGDGCSEICLTEPSAARCGDGVIAGAEECDKGASNDDTAYGGCTTQCRLAPHCGDEALNGSEECDDGQGNNVAYGNRDGCTAACRFPHFCGDAILDTDEGEQCDFGPNNGLGVPGQDSLSWYCTQDCKVILI
jgi:large repetitive protein